MTFLNLIDLGKKSIVLAMLAGIAQYFQTNLTLPKSKAPSADVSFADEFSRSMNTQMRYVLPVIIIFFAYTTSAAVALYWIVSSLFSIGQEFIVRRKMKTVPVS